MTIEDLKKHCIKTIRISEAIESIPNVRVTDNRSLQEHKMVLKLIEAWDKVKEEIKRQIDHNLEVKEKFLVGSYTRIECQVTCTVLADVINIIDKHLTEVENGT